MNSHRGDTQLVFNEGGEKREFTLCFDLNALALLGEKNIDTGKLSNLTLANIGALLDFVHAGLQRHHPEMTRQEVGAIDWDFEKLIKALPEAMNRAYGDLGKKKGKANPSIGKSSKSLPTASA